MILRELRWTDFDPLLESYLEMYEERARGEPIGIGLFKEPPSRSSEVEWFASLYRQVLDGAQVAVVADVDGRAVGLCSVRPTFAGGPGSDGAHVGELGISIDHRHRDRGYGRAMMLRALELARARFEIVRLWVFANNARAIHLYQSLGFERTGRVPNAIQRNGRYFDSELMVLDLRTWRPPVAGANR